MIITLNSPILMRLRDDVPRRLTLNDFFIPKLPDAKPDKDMLALMYESLSEAWERYAANLLPQALKAKLFEDAKKGESPDATVSMRAKKIRFYTPAAGALSITTSLPEEVRVSWKHIPEQNPNYAVRLWSPDKPRPEPLAFTTQDFYTVKIPKEGTYLVQITTEDGRYQSEVRQFSIVLPMSNRGEPPSLTHVNLPLPLLLPPKNFVFHSEQLPVSITFEWDRPNAAQGRQVYTFVLSDQNGKELYKRDLSEMVFHLKFSNPGTYRWFVAASPAGLNLQNPVRTFSEVRTLSVFPALKTLAGKDPLEELLAVSADRLFYLEKLW
jgi:hypothetical protein